MIAVAGFVAFLVLDPPLGVILLVAGVVFEVAETAFWLRFLKRYRIRVGAEALVGESALAIEDCDPDGRVRFRGELWRARCPEGVRAGEEVTIVAVEGLTLSVRPGGGS